MVALHQQAEVFPVICKGRGIFAIQKLEKGQLRLYGERAQFATIVATGIARAVMLFPVPDKCTVQISCMDSTSNFGEMSRAVQGS